MKKLCSLMVAAIVSFWAIPLDAQTYTVGTGTSVYAQTATAPAPLGYYYPNARMQFIYDTASLRAAGMPVGGGTMPIHQIAFIVASLDFSIPAGNFNLQADQTSLASLSTTGFANGLTNRYSSSAGCPLTLGWNVIPFSTPLMWNGTDNIIIEICYATGSSAFGPGNAGIAYTPTTGSVKSNFAVGTGTSPYCGTQAAPNGTLNYRPNIRFTRLLPCTGAPVAGTIKAAPASSGKPFTLSLTGATVAAGLSYRWQYRAQGTSSWNALPGGNVASPAATITAATDFRVIVSCTNATPNLSDTSKVLNVTMAPQMPSSRMHPGTSEAGLASAGIVLYPNPAHDFLTIENQSSESLGNLAIFDMSGRMVYKESVRDARAIIDIRDFSPGVYYLRIDQLPVTRFVKQ